MNDSNPTGDWAARIAQARQNGDTPPPAEVQPAPTPAPAPAPAPAPQEQPAPQAAAPTPAPADKSARPNMANQLPVMLGSVEDSEEVAKVIDAYMSTPEGKARFQAEIENPESFLSHVQRAAMGPQARPQFAALLETLRQQITKDGGSLSPLLPEHRMKVNEGRASYNGVTLSGKEAVLAYLARTSGHRQAALLNSGFFVKMRPLMMKELNSWIMTVDDEFRAYGRLIGGHFHLAADYFMKKQLMTIIHSALISSNAPNIEDPNVFFSLVSIHDYPVLAHAAAVAMYRDGYDIEIICPKCKHVTKDFTIDLRNTIHVNYGIMSEHGLRKMVNTSTTLDALEGYRADVLKMNRTWRKGKVMYTFKVPTMAEYFQMSEAMIAALAASVGADLNTAEPKIARVVEMLQHRSFAPWIQSVTYYKDETSNEVEFIAKDQEAIEGILEQDAMLLYDEEESTDDVFSAATKFIKQSRITHFCYTGVKCPGCGAVAGESVDDYIPIDMPYVLFFLSCRRLA